jgi:cellulose synthase/poly-beta-1,6-N-acetylglucosamine synthase-like glycosyltransferase
MSQPLSIVEAAAAVAFWSSVAGVAYAYVGYPVLIFALSRLLGRRSSPPGDGNLPTVALVIAAHNEGEVLGDRIRNALALDYPRERLEIVIASDGSDDSTSAICAEYEGRVRALVFPQRRGKAATLNAAIGLLTAEIIALSDANTSMDAASLRRLTRWFADPAVGAVCGKLILTDPATGRNADGLYWKYENFLKECESRLDGPLGANGAIYAIRRRLFTGLSPNTVVDDFVIPLAAKLSGGCRIVYDQEAIAHEETAPDLRGEFGRRARIGVGGWQALGLLWPLLSPRFGWTAFTFWSHKVLRWVCPFLLIAAMLASAALAGRPLYAAAAIAQGVFYGACLLAAVLPSARGAMRGVRLCSMFAAMNLALLVGFVRWLRGNHTGVWSRTARVQPGTARAHL